MTSIPKITVVGDANVGKTSIIDRLVFNTFNPLSHSTIGVNHLTKKIDDKKFYIWDTAGQERFHSITKLYFKEANIVIIVIDSYNTDWEKNLDWWVSETKKFTDVPIFILANKFGESTSIITEINSVNNYSPEEIFFVNAKTGIGVSEAFKKIVSYFPKQDSKNKIKLDRSCEQDIDYIVKDCCIIS
jgi:small GTP-binding protein